MSDAEGKAPAGGILRSVALAAATALLALCCVLVWRITVMVGRIEASAVAIGEDVQTVTGACAELTERVGELRDDVAELKHSTKETLHVDEAKAVAAELAEIRAERKSDERPLPDSVEGEIDYLCRYARTEAEEYRYKGKTWRPVTMYLRLVGKKKLYGRTVRDAEDFIERVASSSMTGKEYHPRVVDEDGVEHDMAEWLRAALDAYREAVAAGSTTGDP